MNKYPHDDVTLEYVSVTNRRVPLKIEDRDFHKTYLDACTIKYEDNDTGLTMDTLLVLGAYKKNYTGTIERIEHNLNENDYTLTQLNIDTRLYDNIKKIFIPFNQIMPLDSDDFDKFEPIIIFKDDFNVHTTTYGSTTSIPWIEYKAFHDYKCFSKFQFEYPDLIFKFKPRKSIIKLVDKHDDKVFKIMLPFYKDIPKFSDIIDIATNFHTMPDLNNNFYDYLILMFTGTTVHLFQFNKNPIPLSDKSIHHNKPKSSSSFFFEDDTPFFDPCSDDNRKFNLKLVRSFETTRYKIYKMDIIYFKRTLLADLDFGEHSNYNDHVNFDFEFADYYDEEDQGTDNSDMDSLNLDRMMSNNVENREVHEYFHRGNNIIVGLTSNGKAILWNHNMEKIILTIKSDDNQPLKICKDYINSITIFYNHSTVYVLQNESLIYHRINLKIKPHLMTFFRGYFFYLGEDYRFYRLKVNHDFQNGNPVTVAQKRTVHKMVFKNGCPIRILPSEFCDNKSIVLFKQNNPTALQLLLIDNTSFQHLSQKQLAKAKTSNVLITPLLNENTNHRQDLRNFFIVYAFEIDNNKPTWFLVRLTNVAKFQIVASGTTKCKATNILVDNNANMQLTVKFSGVGIETFILNETDKYTLTSIDSEFDKPFTIHAFSQNGETRFVNPINGIKTNELSTTFKNTSLDPAAVPMKESLLCSAVNLKVATKRVTNALFLSKLQSSDLIPGKERFSNYYRYAERKDSGDLFVAILDSDNYLTIFSDFSAIMPNNYLDLQPFAKFPLVGKFVNIVPVGPEFQNSFFKFTNIDRENSDLTEDMMPLFILLGENSRISIVYLDQKCSPVVEDTLDYRSSVSAEAGGYIKTLNVFSAIFGRDNPYPTKLHPPR